MGFIVREKDQWGAVRFVVEGERVWRGEYATGTADMTITADPYDATRRLVRRSHAQGKVLYCIAPDPYGEGAWGTRLLASLHNLYDHYAEARRLPEELFDGSLFRHQKALLGRAQTRVVCA